jgi:hypothetical protein
MTLQSSRLLSKNREISASRTVYVDSYRIEIIIDNTQYSI